MRLAAPCGENRFQEEAMANCTYGYVTGVNGYSDFAANAMRLTLTALPSLATVKVYVTVTALSGAQTTYLVTGTGTFTFPTARACPCRSSRSTMTAIPPAR
jgi:hypothetical protein